MPKVAPPNPLPGRFCLLAYDRATEEYTLVVDDGARSSYNLGSSVPAVMWYFKTVGKPLMGNRVIDTAREFGVAQGVLRDDRVFRVRGEPQRGDQRDLFQDEEGQKLIQLPPLPS